MPKKTFVIGLTGSIGMGKSETAKMFASQGCLSFDADAVVHALYASGGAAVPLVAKVFPAGINNGQIDREKLSSLLKGEPAAFAKLENIVHPLLRRELENFLAEANRNGVPFAVINIPLLFETGMDRYADAVVVVSAPQSVQRERVLARPGMTEEKFRQILARQSSDAEKRKCADFVIDTGKGFEHAFAEIEAILNTLRGRH